MTRRFKGVAVLLAIAILLLSLYLYRNFPFMLPISFGKVSEQNVEMGLRGLGYEHCGTYILDPKNLSMEFSKVFNNEVRCFLIVKRPGENYTLRYPTLTVLIEPPSQETVYRYSEGVRFFSFITSLALDVDIRPFYQFGAGVLDRTSTPPPPRVANEDLYVVFSYKPEKGGFPVRIALIVKGHDIDMEKKILELQEFAKQPRTKTKLAVQLGIKDIKALMAYVGYELCGEFTAKDVNEVQKVEFEVEIDPNVGRACYILIHPPPGRKAFLLLQHQHQISVTGDMDQLGEYYMKLREMGLEMLISTSYTLTSAFDVLGIGPVISKADVVKPYSERSSLGGGGGGPQATDLITNTPILIFFAYKGDPETFGEPLRFRLKAYTFVKFTIIPARVYIEAR